MANLLLTTYCNLRCPYCFAQERLANGGDRVMSRENFARAVAFLKKSGQPLARLMGGEPTLHPEFGELVEIALGEGLGVDVLSNATWPEEHNALFERIAPSSLRFLLNVDHPERYPERIWARIERNLERVAAAHHVTLSFNFFERQPRYEYLLGLIRRYRIRSVRLSLSLPVLGTGNARLGLDEALGMGTAVVEAARACRQAGADARLDNAVPLCMFTEAEAGELILNGVLELKRNARCEPVIDIGPDLRVWCCFCLSKLWNRRLEEFGDLEAMVAYYRDEMAPYQCELYPLEKCGGCRLRARWGCQGGCLSYTIEKHGPGARGVEAPAGPLALAAGFSMRAHELPEAGWTVRVGDGAPVEVGPEFARLSALVDGVRGADEVVEAAARATVADEGPVGQFARRAAAKAVKEALREMVRKGMVVAAGVEKVRS